MRQDTRRERARKRAGVEANGVKRWLGVVFLAVLAVSDGGCSGAPTAVRTQTPDVVDVPTRPGIVERVLVLTPANPKAVVLLFAGGHGGLDIRQNGVFMTTGLAVNFLVRSRDLFVSQGLTVVVVDATRHRTIKSPRTFLDSVRHPNTSPTSAP